MRRRRGTSADGDDYLRSTLLLLFGSAAYLLLVSFHQISSFTMSSSSANPLTRVLNGYALFLFTVSAATFGMSGSQRKPRARYEVTPNSFP